MNENDHEFVLSNQWGVPAPLDKYLASLSIRKTLNDPSKFNVVLNANFGSETVNLQVDDTEMEVKLSLKQAEVRLYHANCDIDFGKGFSQQHARSETKLSQSLNISTEAAIAVAAGADINKAELDAFFKVSSKLDASQKNSATLTHDKDIKTFNHIEIETVSITGQPFNQFLSGTEIVEYDGWSGVPRDPTRQVGVGATLLAREDWIDFSHCKITKPGKLGDYISNLFASQKSKKTQQFMILLAYLVRRSLQDPRENKYATLACSAFVLEPVNATTHQVNFGEEQEKLLLHPALINQFSSLPTGKHESFVTAVIEAQADVTKQLSSKNFKPSRTRFNAPRGTIFDALRALKELQVWDAEQARSGVRIDEVLESFSQYTLTDLANLGFLERPTKQSPLFVTPFQTTPNEALLFAVMRTTWFPFATEFIETEGIRVSSKAVGAAVSNEFAADWKDSSCQRNGQNIKKWVAVLNPLFASLSPDHQDYYYLQALLAQSDGKGSIPIFTYDLAIEVEFRKLKGISYSDSTASFGTSHRSFREWRKKHSDSHEDARNAANERYSLWLENGEQTD